MSSAEVPNSDGPHNATATADGPSDRRLFAFASFVVGFGLGSLIWALSKAATGHAEPWDASGFYYLGCLFGAGFFSTLVYSRSCLYGTLGVYLGQATYMKFSSNAGDPLILPALLSLTFFGLLPALIGSLIPFVTCKLLKTNRRRSGGG